MTNSRNIDAPSVRGQFGWEQIGSEDLAIPVIIRSDQVRYSPVRIVEQEIIKKYEAIPQSVFSCITLKSFYLTASEAKLLNHVNFHHANGRYGKAFFGVENVIISASDVKDLSRFLNISLEVFKHNLALFTDKLGIVKLSLDENDGSLLVPYISKVKDKDPMRFIPIDLVKSFVYESNQTIRTLHNSWDIMYLKMLTIYSRTENNVIRNLNQDSVLTLLDGLTSKQTGNPVLYEDFFGETFC